MDGTDGVPGTNGPRGLKGEMVRQLRSSFLQCVYVVCWCALQGPAGTPGDDGVDGDKGAMGKEGELVSDNHCTLALAIHVRQDFTLISNIL